jgi:hypothetical protein
VNDSADQTPVEVDEVCERIQSVLADYPGLASVEDRKAADDLLLKQLAGLLEDFLNQIFSVESYLAQTEQLDTLAIAREVAQKIEMLMDKLHSVPYAFSPFLTFDRIPEKMVREVEACDWNLLSVLEATRKAIDPAVHEASDFEGVLRTALELISNLDTCFEARLNAILALQ